MKSFQVVTVSLLAGFVVLACSTSNQNIPTGVVCPADFNPAPQNVQDAQKTSLAPKPDGTMNFKSGVYNYDHAVLYYADARLAPNDNYRIYMQDTKDSNGVFHASVNCIRNARPGLGLQNIALSVKGLGGMTIDGQNKLDPNSTSVKSYSFDIEPEGQLAMNFNTALNEKPSIPTDPTSASTDPQTYAFVHPDNADIVDLRSTGEAKDGSGNVIGTWFLSITFVRSNLP